MSRELPPPIGANRVDEAAGGGTEPTSDGLGRFSPTVRVVGAAVALVLAIVAGFIGYRIIAEDQQSDSGDADWNAIAVRDPRSGTITVVDGDGDQLDTFESSPGIGRFDASGPYVLSQTGDTAEIVDTRDGDIMTVQLEPGEQAAFLASPLPWVAVSGDTGNIRIADPKRDEVIDVAAVAGLAEPRLRQRDHIDAENEVLGVVDEADFQSILVDLHGDDPVFLPGQLLALDHGTALTAQVIGDRAEVRFSSLDGDPLDTVETGTPASGYLTSDDTALIVTRDGALLRLTAGIDEPEQIAALDVDDEQGGEIQAFLLPSPGRLVHRSAAGEVVITGWEGDELLRTPGVIRPTRVPQSRLACIAVAEDSDGSFGEESPTQLFSADDGAEIGDAFQTARSTQLLGSADGCTVVENGPRRCIAGVRGQPDQHRCGRLGQHLSGWLALRAAGERRSVAAIGGVARRGPDRATRRVRRVRRPLIPPLGPERFAPAGGRVHPPP